MDDDEFSWDDSKAARNFVKHGVSFDRAMLAIRDAFAIETIDDRQGYGEERVNLIGMSASVLLHVTYTERDGRIHIISARRAENMSKTTTIAKIRADGGAVEVMPDNSERPFPRTPLRPMTDEEVHAAAMADPDARPMTDEEWQAARKVPRTKTLRRALGLTQAEFAARFHIPIGTLRDWEQEKSQPDHAARAYLRAIAGDPAAVQRALEMGPESR